MSIIKNPKNILIVLLIIFFIISLCIFLVSKTSSNKMSPNRLTIENTTTTENSTVIEIIQTTEELYTSENAYNTPSTQDINNATSTDENTSLDTTENVSDVAENDIIDSEEYETEISPSEQTLLDAGFGKVVLLPTGDYGILMQSPDHMIEGKRGNEILREHLASLGLEGTIYGCWMNDQYYNFFAENIHELITPDDEEFWD